MSTYEEFKRLQLEGAALDVEVRVGGIPVRLGDPSQTEWSAALGALFPVGMTFAEEVEAGRRSFDEWKPLLLEQEAVVAWWDAHRRGQ